MSDCNHSKTRCVDTRKRGGYVWRRRECKICKTRVSSVELALKEGLNELNVRQAIRLSVEILALSKEKRGIIYSVLRELGK